MPWFVFKCECNICAKKYAIVIEADREEQIEWPQWCDGAGGYIVYPDGEPHDDGPPGCGHQAVHVVD